MCRCNINLAQLEILENRENLIKVKYTALETRFYRGLSSGTIYGKRKQNQIFYVLIEDYEADTSNLEAVV